MRVPKPGLLAVVAYSGTRMECQNDRVLSLLHPVPGGYHYEVVGCGYGWMSSALKTLRSTRNLMQNTLDFDVINPVDSQHDTCKTIWLTCRGQVGLSIHIPILWPGGGYATPYI